MADYTGERFTPSDVLLAQPDSSRDGEKREGTGGVPVVTYYYQRVWDSGSGGRWCYYEMTTVNPTPLSTETTPNWTGAISAHSIVSTRTA